MTNEQQAMLDVIKKQLEEPMKQFIGTPITHAGMGKMRVIMTAFMRQCLPPSVDVVDVQQDKKDPDMIHITLGGPAEVMRMLKDIMEGGYHEH